MKDVLIYTKGYCPYCHAAKALLNKKGAKFTEIDLEIYPEKRDEMIKRAGGKTTVPQIFIKGQYIGGNSDMQALEAQGRLDALLEGIRQ